MYSTWRSTVAHGLLGVGVVVAIVVALTTGTGNGPVRVILPWLIVALVGTGLVLSWLQQRELENRRRHLAQGLTHHMRTSLAHIRTYNEMLLLGRARSEDERQDWLEVVGREAERLGSAVENLLLIFNQRRRDAYPIRREVDLGELLEDVACEYASSDGPGLQFQSGPPSGIVVQADATALRHAFGNLFQSLGRFCEPGTSLSAQLTSDGSTATVRVDLPATNGTGYRLRSRNVFRVRDPEGATEAGFGLELAVVEHVIRAHGGRAVSFQDATRAGYRLELPVR